MQAANPILECIHVSAVCSNGIPAQSGTGRSFSFSKSRHYGKNIVHEH